jgi:8-oxo-dGTP diphosphatase
MSQPIIQIAGVFIEDDVGRLVLQLRDDIPTIPHPGHWSVWGGQIEEGESPIEAAAREVREELTLNVQIESLRYVTSGISVSPPREWYAFYWEAGDAVNQAHVTEGQRLGRFFIDEIATGMLEGRPVIPWILRTFEEFRVWRERTRIT